MSVSTADPSTGMLGIYIVVGHSHEPFLVIDLHFQSQTSISHHRPLFLVTDLRGKHQGAVRAGSGRRINIVRKSNSNIVSVILISGSEVHLATLASLDLGSLSFLHHGMKLSLAFLVSRRGYSPLVKS